MGDLGTIGGTQVFVNDLNNRGEVVGGMTTRVIKPFTPFSGTVNAMKDLGTLGGDFGAQTG